MKSKVLVMFAVVAFAFSFFCGCAKVRTYTVVKERVDQNLSAGNQGYLAGTVKDTDVNKERRLTRKTYVTEVEIGSAPSKSRVVTSNRQGMAVEAVEEPASEPIKETEISGPDKDASKSTVTSYTVQNNDTLQKISIKVYGSSKKWKKIFEANADQLKSPDKIYAGQVLKIPQE